MTTRIHVVNFGPGKVLVAPEDHSHPGQVIWPNSYADFHVYKGRMLVVNEVCEDVTDPEIGQK